MSSEIRGSKSPRFSRTPYLCRPGGGDFTAADVIASMLRA
jgi:hypothetical protein